MRRFRYTGQLGKPFDIANTLRSRGGTWSRTARQLKANQPQCVKCGSIMDLEADHVVPLHRGGTNDISNLQVLCKDCHARKTASEIG